jgi:hypothetical protein
VTAHLSQNSVNKRLYGSPGRRASGRAVFFGFSAERGKSRMFFPRKFRRRRNTVVKALPNKALLSAYRFSAFQKLKNTVFSARFFR